MDKKILIVGNATDALSAALQIQMAKLGHGAEYITTDEASQAKERGITFNYSSDMASRVKEIINDKLEENTMVPFQEPLSRRERRAKERKNGR